MTGSPGDDRGEPVGGAPGGALGAAEIIQGLALCVALGGCQAGSEQAPAATEEPAQAALAHTCGPLDALTALAASDIAALQAALGQPASLTARRCPDFEDDSFDASIELAAFLAADVAATAAAPSLSALAGYYGAYGIRFSLAGAPKRLSQERLIGQGPPKQALAPLRTFLRQHARAAPAPGVPMRVNIVFVHAIAPHTASYFKRLEGLSISARLRAQGDPLADLLGVEDGMVPTMLVALEGRPGNAGAPPLTAAHELGHLLGLTHPPSDRPSDLMSSGPHPCVPGLLASQRARVRETLARWQP